MFDLTQSCSDASSALWGILDFSIAPPLLFYAYIPIIVISLFLGGFVLMKERHSLASKLLFVVSIVFTLLLLNEILQWIDAPVSLVQFGWQLVPIFRALVAILTLYFVYVFIKKGHPPFPQKLVLSSFFVSVLLLGSTKLNIISFDLTNCEGEPGLLWNVTHIFELVSMVWIIVLIFTSSFHGSLPKGERYRNMLLGSGAALFLLIFFSASVWG